MATSTHITPHLHNSVTKLKEACKVLKYRVLKRCLWLSCYKSMQCWLCFPFFAHGYVAFTSSVKTTLSFSFWTQCYGYFKIIHKFVVWAAYSFSDKRHMHTMHNTNLSLKWHIPAGSMLSLYFQFWFHSNSHTSHIVFQTRQNTRETFHASTKSSVRKMELWTALGTTDETPIWGTVQCCGEP